MVAVRPPIEFLSQMYPDENESAAGLLHQGPSNNRREERRLLKKLAQIIVDNQQEYQDENASPEQLLTNDVEVEEEIAEPFYDYHQDDQDDDQVQEQQQIQEPYYQQTEEPYIAQDYEVTKQMYLLLDVSTALFLTIFKCTCCRCLLNLCQIFMKVIAQLLRFFNKNFIASYTNF